MYGQSEMGFHVHAIIEAFEKLILKENKSQEAHRNADSEPTPRLYRKLKNIRCTPCDHSRWMPSIFMDNSHVTIAAALAGNALINVGPRPV